MNVVDIEAAAREGAAAAEKPASGFRPLAVSFGPSFVLDLAVAGGIALAGAAALKRPFTSRPGRILAPLGAVAATVPWAYVFLARPWVLNCGATEEETRQSLPGDDLLPHPIVETTRAVTVRAPAAGVWPWLVQIGQGRGGLYSYDWLENIGGLDIHSVDRIVPELQQLAIGDVIRLAPGQDTLAVATLEAGRALVLRVLDPATGQPVDPSSTKPFFAATWAFVLDERSNGTTRLIARWRFDGRPRYLWQTIYQLLVEIPHFVMEWKMLAGIAERAERRRTVGG